MTNATTPAAIAWSALKKLRGEAVVYARGELTLPLIAVPGSRQNSSTTDQQVVLENQNQDWLIDGDQPGAPFDPPAPQPGDTLTQTTTGQVYEVVAKGTERAWRWNGPDRVWRRVRMREIDS